MSQCRRRYRPGSKLSGTSYRVVRFIGSGAMGAVYEVHHEELGKNFVIKALHQDLVQHDEPVRRLRSEWRALARLEHPNIVAVTDAGVTLDGIPYFVMECLSGETLLSRMNREIRWPVIRVVAFALDLLDGIAAAHAIGIVHRDIKPPNIFLPKKGGVKLLDFGIAKAFGRSATVTVKGVTLGTPRYMAPEQAIGDEADTRSDLYAVGVILFELIAGRHPFAQAQTPVEMLIAHANWKAPPLPRDTVGLPPKLATIVANLLSKDPNERPTTALIVRERLQNLSTNLVSPGTCFEHNSSFRVRHHEIAHDAGPLFLESAPTLRNLKAKKSTKPGLTAYCKLLAVTRRTWEIAVGARRIIHLSVAAVLSVVVLYTSSLPRTIAMGRSLLSVGFSRHKTGTTPPTVISSYQSGGDSALLEFPSDLKAGQKSGIVESSSRLKDSACGNPTGYRELPLANDQQVLLPPITQNVSKKGLTEYSAQRTRDIESHGEHNARGSALVSIPGARQNKELEYSTRR